MKSISSGLAAMLAANCTTRAALWNVVRRDGLALAFSAFDRDLEFQGIVYPARSGFSTASEIQTGGGLNVDNLDVTSYFDPDGITEVDVAAGLWDRARIRLSLVNWKDLSQGALFQRWGEIGNVRYSTARGYVAELRGLMQALANNIGETYGANCPFQFGGAIDPVTHRGCGKDLAPLTQTFTVTAVTNRREIAVSGLTGADNTFRYGILEFATGSNAGFQMEVRASTSGGGLSLQLQMPFDIAPGDTGEIVPGCEKTEAACIEFSNILNFGGFADIPGMDRMLNSGTE